MYGNWLGQIVIVSEPVTAGLTTSVNVAIESQPDCDCSVAVNSYTTAGTYNVTLKSQAGCDSIATLNLSVNTIVTSTTDVVICNNQLPYTWNGNTYSVAGTYKVTLTNQAGCDSIATLIITVGPALTSTTDITICTNQLPYTWNGNTYTAAGTYTVTLTSQTGCDSIATLNLTTGAVVTSTTDAVICTSQLPYTWNANTYSSAGTYSVTLVTASGCDSLATLNLAVSPAITSTTNVVICNSLLPYTWNGNNYSVPGTYNVTLSSQTGCDSIATLNLSVNPVVTSTLDVTICNNQLPYTWNGNSYTASGTYTATLSSQTGCDSIATLILTVSSVVTSTTNVALCSNQLPYTWNGNDYNLAGSYNVTLTNQSGCDSIATLILAIDSALSSTTNVALCANQLPYTWNGNRYTVAGTYNVTLKSQSGCDSIATLVLSSNPLFTADALI